MHHSPRGHRTGQVLLSPLAFVLAAQVGTCSIAAATDEEQLKALHEKVMEAHRQSNIELLLEDEAPDYVVLSRGRVTWPILAERRAKLGSYLERTDFQEYRDLIEPLVTVSADGTLGWVIVQVYARGTQGADDGSRETLEFTCAWIELYQRHEDRWYRVGNASNFKE